MTRIDFHCNVAHPLLYACRLVRKAYTNQVNVVITMPSEMLEKLDETLWTFSQTDFIPHCYTTSQNAAQTPVVLATDSDLDKLPHYQVLINLSAQIPTLFARFERLLEIVSTAESERLAGRERYRFYRDRGYPLQSFDQSGVA
jgi:DNA polymerase-3 subunit chi